MTPPPPTIDEWLSEQQQPQQQRATPVVVKIHNPGWSMLDTQAPESAAASKAGRGRNAKQLTWVLRLKAHQAVGSVQAAWTRLSSSSKPVFFIEEEPKTHKGKLYQFIRGCLAFAVLMLMFEVAAHTMGWPQQYLGTRTTAAGSLTLQGLLRSLYWTWLYVRANYVAPLLQALTHGCTVLFLVQSVDKLVLCLGCLWIKFRRIRPEAKPELLESGGYPTVLCQIPMCNEREVYQLSISAVCRLDWPRDRLLVQVLDDSSDEDIQMLIKAEVLKWQQKGVRIVYRHRQLRTGYKAGNLKSAMSCDYVKDYEYVAIFDADFQPKPEFLKQTLPHLMEDPKLALVQARWAFVNKDDNLLTRLQNINMSFHFEVEQQVNGVFLNYFGFNGTAGVWRMAALQDSGGWMERTTVEDMDTAVRAHLRGWKFIFLNDVRVLCELPDSYEAYRKQQHRWNSGPMHLFRLCIPDVIKSKIPLWRKANLVCLFFVLRRLILPLYSFTLFCVILPLTMFVPESHLPVWVICYVPAVMSLLTILPSPRSFPFFVPYIFLENAMSVTKFNAMISGLFQLSSAYEWVVTKKKGRVSSETDLLSLTSQKDEEPDRHLLRGSSETQAQLLSKLQPQKTPAKPAKRVVKLYRKELMLAFFLLTASVRSLLSAQGVHFYLLVFQGVSFLVIGLDLIKQKS